ncbi:MAG: dethiobiotin synthetase [Myxococcales bacterium]|nr:dethiobiotin synthetase [Myxococcales bacterium]
MTAPLVVVTGTGTGIGKTHAAVGLVLAWARLLREAGLERPEVAGLKPVETGVVDGATTDASTLEHASTFHVKRFPPPYMLARAVSPHLAAADEGRTIELAPIRDFVAAVRAAADAVVVELPGGLFSPLGPQLDNADVARGLAPDALLLVVPDRLGVLHDVAAATRAAHASGLSITGIVMVAPEHADASTGTNAVELAVVTDVPVLAQLPRADVATLSARADLSAILGELVRTRTPSPVRP